MNKDKACLHPLVWPDVCGHGDEMYVGTVAAKITGKVHDVYVYGIREVQVCLRSGSRRYTYHHMTLDTFWSAADAYPPWHPARDLLLSQGFTP